IANLSEVKKLIEYTKQYKALAHGKNMARRTVVNSFLAGAQTLLSEGGDIDKAMAEAKTTMRMQGAFEAVGFGMLPFLPKELPKGEASKIASREEEVMRAAERQSKSEERAESANNYAAVGLSGDPTHKVMESSEPEDDSKDHTLS